MAMHLKSVVDRCMFRVLMLLCIISISVEKSGRTLGGMGKGRLDWDFCLHFVHCIQTFGRGLRSDTTDNAAPYVDGRETITNRMHPTSKRHRDQRFQRDSRNRIGCHENGFTNNERSPEQHPGVILISF